MKVRARNKAIGVTIKLNEEEATRLYEILNYSAEIPYQSHKLSVGACEDFSQALWEELDGLGYRCD